MDPDASERVQLFRQAVTHVWAKRTPKKRKLDPNLKRDLAHGWMIPYLIDIDQMTWQRWDYWCRTMTAYRLIDDPIPLIEFGHAGRYVNDGSPGHTHLQDCLNLIPNHGSWEGWESWTYVEYFFDWLLYALGYVNQKELPSEPSGCEGASMRLYQAFNLGIVMAHPHDYWGDILAANKFGRKLGFYPTPHSVVEMMVRMLFIGEEEFRDKTVADCCLGTGRMLLHASNYSLRLYGMDINGTVLKASLINAYWYAPWMVKPFPFLDGELVHGDALVGDGGKTVSEVVTESLLTQGRADPRAAKYLEGAIYDKEEAWKYSPLQKAVVPNIPPDQQKVAQKWIKEQIAQGAYERK